MSAIASRQAYEDARLMTYKPGSIQRVKLVNFLTYSEVEFNPGPRLNVVIGPNGTGKSSILCAICLGLGGSPVLLGRADDVRLFIMHEKDQAMIEIELTPNRRDNQVHILRRVIERNKGSDRGRGRGASTFFINNDRVSEKDIKELVASYNIAVDNLCTFLPQDRVGNFSGLDRVELLQETEKAMSKNQHIYRQHQELIEAERELQNAGNSEKTMQDRLKTLEADNERLEREKGLMEERERAAEQVRLLEQKKAWLEFEKARLKALELKGQKTQAVNELREAQAVIQPLAEKHNMLKEKLELSRTRYKSMEATVERAKKELDKQFRKHNKFEEEIDNETGNLTAIESMQRNAQRRIESDRERVEELEAAMARFPEISDVEKEKEEALHSLRSLKNEMGSARNETDRIDQEMNDLSREARDAESKLARMADEKTRRRDRIFQQNEKLQATFAWIEANRKNFRRPVWGPIACEISTKSITSASYIEQHVANTTMKAYVVECKEDYDHLYNEVRQKLRLPINIFIVPQGQLRPISRMYSNEKMRILREEHGIEGYLDECFSAPDAVLEALRISSNVQSVLVGTEKTQESLDRRGLLDYLSQRENGQRGAMASCIFARHMNRSNKYTTIVSRYSGKTSLRVDGVDAPRMLAPGTNPEQKSKLEDMIQLKRSQIEDLRPTLVKARKRMEECEKTGQGISAKIKTAKQTIADIKSTKSRLELAVRKLQELQDAAMKDNAVEKETIKKRLRNHISNAISSLELANKSQEEIMAMVASLAGAKMGDDGLAAAARRARDELAETENLMSELERRLNKIDHLFSSQKKVMRQLKESAQKIAALQDSDGNDLPLKEVLQELPATLDEVDAALEESILKVNSIADNPEVIRQYNERQSEIKNLQEEMSNINEVQEMKRERMKGIREPWEAALKNTISKVNILFGKYMTELGCAGEVRLYRGNSNDGSNNGSFKDWGVEILVKFRDTSNLQVLSAQVQSGGERSVSTIMYLMALQELMVSPFRCVDEINQGLDERNERLVFRRIVKNSTHQPKDKSDSLSHSGQYFLITPKLLPNLTDMENDEVTILCIYNGKSNFKHFGDWDVARFISMRAQGRAVKESDDEEVVPRRSKKRRSGS